MKLKVDAIHVTPLAEIELAGRVVLAKLEKDNPSGSHKHRAARLIVDILWRTEQLNLSKISCLVASSSGNFAKSIAYWTSPWQIPIEVVTDVLSPSTHLKPLQHYPHVRLTVVDDPDSSGSHVQARMRVIEKILESNPNAIFIDQYANFLIPLAYETSLVPEILAQLNDDEIGAIFVPVGTGGLLCGFLQYKQRHQARWKIFGVDALGSGLFRPPQGVKRHLSGYGGGKPTGLVAYSGASDYAVVFVSDAEALSMCGRLRQKENLFVGPSSGAVAAACEKIITTCPGRLPHSGHLVLIMPDGGENYVHTAFSDDWLITNGFASVALTSHNNYQSKSAARL